MVTVLEILITCLRHCIPQAIYTVFFLLNSIDLIPELFVYILDIHNPFVDDPIRLSQT